MTGEPAVFDFEVCTPLDPWNFGTIPIGHGCDVDHECAPLDLGDPNLVMQLKGTTDKRIGCFPYVRGQTARWDDKRVSFYDVRSLGLLSLAPIYIPPAPLVPLLHPTVKLLCW